MEPNKKVLESLSKAEKDSKEALKNSPKAETGCCTISSGGYSEQKSGITKDACDSQKAPGFTVSWKKGSC